MKKFAFIAMTIVLVMSGAILAGEVPVIIPADFDGYTPSPDAHWIWTFMASPLAVGAVAWVARFIDESIRARRIMKENAVLQQCYAFASQGAATSYYEFVRNLKHKAADGKLTEDEKKEAMGIAKQKAIIYARNNGVDLLKKVGPEVVRDLIEQAVRNRKAGQLVAGPLARSRALAPLPPSVQ